MIKRKPVVARLPVEFRAQKDHVVAVFSIDGGKSTIGMRFESPEQMLWFFTAMMDKAAEVWPENEWITDYMQR